MVEQLPFKQLVPSSSLGRLIMLKSSLMFYLYILYNSSIDKYYIGQTSNLNKRIIDHNSTGHKVKYTKKQSGKWSLVYKEEFETRSEAITREKFLKGKKSRSYIKEVINAKSSPDL